jgi:hypothetical protein
MGTLSKTPTQCKRRKLSPLRVARVDALLNYLDGGTTTVSSNFYNGLRINCGWPRGVVDQVIDDAAVLGKVRIAADEWEVTILVLAEENSPCSVA